MNSKDVALSFLIVFIFFIIVVWNIVSSNIGNIQNNWPKYRCNPLIMPFASFWGHKPAENFYQCIQSIQKQNMPAYLQPMNYAVSLAGNTGRQVTNSVQGSCSGSTDECGRRPGTRHPAPFAGSAGG